MHDFGDADSRGILTPPRSAFSLSLSTQVLRVDLDPVENLTSPRVNTTQRRPWSTGAMALLHAQHGKLQSCDCWAPARAPASRRLLPLPPITHPTPRPAVNSQDHAPCSSAEHPQSRTRPRRLACRVLVEIEDGWWPDKWRLEDCVECPERGVDLESSRVGWCLPSPLKSVQDGSAGHQGVQLRLSYPPIIQETRALMSMLEVGGYLPASDCPSLPLVDGAATASNPSEHRRLRGHWDLITSSDTSEHI